MVGVPLSAMVSCGMVTEEFCGLEWARTPADKTTNAALERRVMNLALSTASLLMNAFPESTSMLFNGQNVLKAALNPIQRCETCRRHVNAQQFPSVAVRSCRSHR